MALADCSHGPTRWRHIKLPQTEVVAMSTEDYQHLLKNPPRTLVCMRCNNELAYVGPERFRPPHLKDGVLEKAAAELAAAGSIPIGESAETVVAAIGAFNLAVNSQGEDQ